MSFVLFLQLLLSSSLPPPILFHARRYPCVPCLHLSAPDMQSDSSSSSVRLHRRFILRSMPRSAAARPFSSLGHFVLLALWNRWNHVPHRLLPRDFVSSLLCCSCPCVFPPLRSLSVTRTVLPSSTPHSPMASLPPSTLPLNAKYTPAVRTHPLTSYLPWEECILPEGKTPRLAEAQGIIALALSTRKKEFKSEYK